MRNLLRSISLYFRQRSALREQEKTWKQYTEWSRQIETLAPYKAKAKKQALIRLDDIGDYLLFRDFLADYHTAVKRDGYTLTLIGNVVWKPIFEACDASAADDMIWVEKSRYFSDEHYRRKLWEQLRNEGFETVICPSRTRPLLLDDILVQAIAAPTRKAANNSLAYPQWNIHSDQLYTVLYPAGMPDHEFLFNSHLADFMTGIKSGLHKPYLPLVSKGSTTHDYILCFIGASAKSKRWPFAHWVRLVELLREKGYVPLLSGGPQELPLAEQIVSATGVDSIAGKTGLMQTLETIADAQAVISGDTMAAHAGVALNTPTIILANGVNAGRFVAYEPAGIGNTHTLYTKPYLASGQQKDYKAVSSDMQTILPKEVLAALTRLLS